MPSSVNPRMLDFGHEDQVIQGVIKSVTICVMDNMARRDGPISHPPDNPMGVACLPVLGNKTVTATD